MVRICIEIKEFERFPALVSNLFCAILASGLIASMVQQPMRSFTEQANMNFGNESIPSQACPEWEIQLALKC